MGEVFHRREFGVGSARLGCCAGQHGDAHARGDHLAYGFQRTAFQTLLQTGVNGTLGTRAGLQHLISETVAAGQEQQCLAAQIGGSDARFFRPVVACRHDHAKRFIVDRVGDDTRLTERLRQQDQIDVAILQHLAQTRGVVFLDQQRHFRRALHDQRDQLGCDIRPHGVDGAKTQRPGEIVLARRRDVLDGGGFLQHALRLLALASLRFLPSQLCSNHRGLLLLGLLLGLMRFKMA